MHRDSSSETAQADDENARINETSEDAAAAAVAKAEKARIKKQKKEEGRRRAIEIAKQRNAQQQIGGKG